MDEWDGWMDDVSLSAGFPELGEHLMRPCTVIAAECQITE